MTRRSRHIKVYALLASPVSPGSKGLALGSVKGQPVDVVWGGPSCHSDNIVIFEEHLFSFDFIFENVMNATVQNSLIGIPDVHGPNEALVDNFDHFWEASNGVIIEKGALVNIAKRTGLVSCPLNGDGFFFRGSSKEGGFRFLSGD